MTVEFINTVTNRQVNAQVNDQRHPASSTSELISESITVLKAVFESITPDSCPRRANFHMHTVHSDGSLTSDELVQQAIAIGLQNFAITDHHSIEGYRRAQHHLDDYAAQVDSVKAYPLPRLWSGVEVNANLVDVEVHILCYGFDPSADAMQPYIQGESVEGDRYQAAAVIESVHDAGGLAVLAHPCRYRRSPAELIPEASQLGMDGVETYYAYDNPSPWRPSPEPTQMVHQLVEHHRLLHTCGTDTHGLDLLKRL